jgi:hypothetical protein
MLLSWTVCVFGGQDRPQDATPKHKTVGKCRWDVVDQCETRADQLRVGTVGIF